MRAMPAWVMSSHQDRLRLVSVGQPWPMALREASVRAEQLEMLRLASLVQCWARQWNVLSDSFLQLDRSRVSILQQVWENVHSAESPTFCEETGYLERNLSEKYLHQPGNRSG